MRARVPAPGRAASSRAALFADSSPAASAEMLRCGSVAVGPCLLAGAPIDGRSGASECCWSFLQNRGEPRLSDGAGFGLTIAPRVEPARDHLAAHRDVDCCPQPLGLLRPNRRPPRPFVAAKPHGSAYLRRRPRARTALAAETPRTSRPTAGAAHAQETRAGPDSTEGAGSAEKLAFPQG